MAKILLVEDDLLIQRAVENKLKREGFEVMCFNDGKEALEAFDTYRPDLILTDMMLPTVSGLKILMTAKDRNPPLKVIVFSTLGQENVVEEAFIAGADDYVTKPFSLVELTIRIKKQLHLL